MRLDLEDSIGFPSELFGSDFEVSEVPEAELSLKDSEFPDEFLEVVCVEKSWYASLGLSK